MKHIVLFILLISALAVHTACSRGADSGGASALESAELAFANGRYAGAQMLCDSIILGRDFGALSAVQLCRLTLLFVRLSENHGNEDANTAFAARSLRAAMAKSPDSTAVFLSDAPVEDQARLALITAINEGLDRPADADSTLYEEPDTSISLYY